MSVWECMQLQECLSEGHSVSADQVNHLWDQERISTPSNTHRMTCERVCVCVYTHSYMCTNRHTHRHTRVHSHMHTTTISQKPRLNTTSVLIFIMTTRENFNTCCIWITKPHTSKYNPSHVYTNTYHQQPAGKICLHNYAQDQHSTFCLNQTIISKTCRVAASDWQPWRHDPGMRGWAGTMGWGLFIFTRMCSLCEPFSPHKTGLPFILTLAFEIKAVFFCLMTKLLNLLFVNPETTNRCAGNKVYTERIHQSEHFHELWKQIMKHAQCIIKVQLKYFEFILNYTHALCQHDVSKNHFMMGLPELMTGLKNHFMTGHTKHVYVTSALVSPKETLAYVSSSQKPPTPAIEWALAYAAQMYSMHVLVHA